MIKGIGGKSYIDLSKFIDHNSFVELHPMICRGFSIGKGAAAIGNLEVPEGFINLAVYANEFTPLYKLYNIFLNLPETNPMRVQAVGLTDAELAMYLKFAMGGYDLYSYYFLYDFKDGWRNGPRQHCILPEAQYFPTVVNWVENLVTLNIFSHIGRVAFFVQEAGGISFEHKDPSVDPEHADILSEFIHIRINLNRPFYIKDIETSEKFYINTCVSYWNDQDFHGGDTIMEPSYAFRVDGIFTEEFRKKIKSG